MVTVAKRKDARKPQASAKKKPGPKPIFKSAKALQELIDGYFSKIDQYNKENMHKNVAFKPYTMSGLANHLDIHRTTLVKYGKKDAFYKVVQRARGVVEESVEEQLMRGRNATGCIFNLKVNFGWKENGTEERGGDSLTLKDIEILKRAGFFV